MSEKIGVAGAGWVGRSMIEMFPEATVYDEPKIVEQAIENGIDPTLAIATGRFALNQCDIAFICVPTPNRQLYPAVGERFDGSLDSSIVEEVVGWCEADVIVLRSTVNPGTSDYLTEKYNKHIVMQPEFLGESVAHPMLDQQARPFMILGGEPADRRKVIEAYQEVYNANINIRQVTNKEAEVIKLSENRAIAYKVAQAQELYDACEAADVDFYTIREAVYGDDPRFNLWFTFVYPEARGMDSKCIPKDPWAWCAWAESVGYDPVITRTILERNKGWLMHNELRKIDAETA